MAKRKLIYVMGSLLNCGKNWLKSVSTCQQAVTYVQARFFLIERYTEQKNRTEQNRTEHLFDKYKHCT